MNVEQHYHTFLDEVAEYLRPIQDRVKVSELGKRIRKPPEINHIFPSFSKALRADPLERFQFFGSDNTVSVQLAPRRPPSRQAATSAQEHGSANILGDAREHISISSSAFVCPITQEKMRDPVIAADGFTYERSAIETWFASCRRSPSTNNDLPNTKLIPNRILKQIIEDSTEIDFEAVIRPATAAAEQKTSSCRSFSSTTVPQTRLPSAGEAGLWVYEVVHAGMAFADAEDITSVGALVAGSVSNSTGICFVEGQLLSSTFRKSNAAKVDVVQLEHGFGWVCLAHLRSIEISPELKVFQVSGSPESAKKIATRAIPDFRRGFMLSRYASALPYAVRPGQVLASSQSVTDGTGAVYVRVEGGWLPDRKQTGRGRTQVLMIELQQEHSVVVYRVVNTSGLALRQWPCHTSSKVQPPTLAPKDSLLASRTWVRGEQETVYLHVEVDGVKGWVFAARDGKSCMERVAKRPTVQAETPGAHVQVQLGPCEGGWVLLIDEPGCAQIQRWSGTISGLARQMNNCEAKGRRVKRFAMCPDGEGWMCHGEKDDGSGGFVWSGGLGGALAEVVERPAY